MPYNLTNPELNISDNGEWISLVDNKGFPPTSVEGAPEEWWEILNEIDRWWREKGDTDFRAMAFKRLRCDSPSDVCGLRFSSPRNATGKDDYAYMAVEDVEGFLDASRAAIMDALGVSAPHLQQSPVPTRYRNPAEEDPCGWFLGAVPLGTRRYAVVLPDGEIVPTLVRADEILVETLKWEVP